MCKIKVIWKDDSESYVVSPHQYTQFIDQAKDYKSLLIAARSARRIKEGLFEFVNDVRLIENGEEYIMF